MKSCLQNYGQQPIWNTKLFFWSRTTLEGIFLFLYERWRLCWEDISFQILSIVESCFQNDRQQPIWETSLVVVRERFSDEDIKSFSDDGPWNQILWQQPIWFSSLWILELWFFSSCWIDSDWGVIMIQKILLCCRVIVFQIFEHCLQIYKQQLIWWTTSLSESSFDLLHLDLVLILWLSTFLSFLSDVWFLKQ